MPKKNFISENPKIPVASFEIPCFLPWKMTKYAKQIMQNKKKCLPTYPTSDGVCYQNHTFFRPSCWFWHL
jgi:hypothetical protein